MPLGSGYLDVLSQFSDDLGLGDGLGNDLYGKPKLGRSVYQLPIGSKGFASNLKFDVVHSGACDLTQIYDLFSKKKTAFTDIVDAFLTTPGAKSCSKREKHPEQHGKNFLDFVFPDASKQLGKNDLIDPNTMKISYGNPGIALMAGLPFPSLPFNNELIPPMTDKQKKNYEPRGLLRYVPRVLLTFGLVDWLNMIVASLHSSQTCDGPLATWLLGSVALGFPVSYLIAQLAVPRTAYMRYRVRIQKLRNGATNTNRATNSHKCDCDIYLRNQHNWSCREFLVGYSSRDNGWTREFGFRRPVSMWRYFWKSGYQPMAYDPVSWVIEAKTEESEDWVVLEKVEDHTEFPAARGGRTDDFEMAQYSLNNSFETKAVQAAVPNSRQFRTAFLLELLFDAVSFFWLATGTLWLSNTDMCIDTAPILYQYVFIQIIASWSVLGVGTLFLILTSVAAVIVQTRQSEQKR